MAEKTKGYQRNFQNYLFLQRVATKTMEAYLRSVAALSAFHQQPPESLSNEQIQDFLLYNIQEKRLAWSSCNVLFCALKKYYQGFLGRGDSEFSIPPRPRARQLPMLLSREEVRRIISVSANIKHRALLTTIYGSGLRASEAVRLRPEHIESGRMMVRVEQGKGRKDRYTILSRHCLDLLREYWRVAHPGEWLFFGKDRNKPMPVGTAQKIYYQAKKEAGVTRGHGIHTLRHCFATHLHEEGAELYIIKRRLGHTEWIVYAKKPFAGPEQVLAYLGRYTHRIAISNHRIKSIVNSRIIFTYRDRSDGNQVKTMPLDAMEFIRRFLLHVLPGRFMKIRYYGFLANACKKKAVLLIRRPIGKYIEVKRITGETVREKMLRLTGRDILLCPHCRQGRMVFVGLLPGPDSG